MNIISYKDYQGKFECDEHADIFHGDWKILVGLYPCGVTFSAIF